MTGHAHESLHGLTPDVGSPAARLDALEKAFDYRGDVTLVLADGRSLVAYVSNRDFTGPDPWLECYPAQEGASCERIPVAQVTGVLFSGRDTADGRSWEAWVAKWEAKKAAEAAGHVVPDIEPKPTHL